MLHFLWACLFSPTFANNSSSLCNSSNPLSALFDSSFKLQNQLTEKLFENYNIAQPAVFRVDKYNNEYKYVQVNVTLLYFRLLTIDEARQSAQVYVSLFYQWVDPRLAWNSSDFCGMEQIAVVNKNTVWLPDVLPFDIYSNKDVLDRVQQTVNIAHNGSMGLYRRTIADIVCPMDMRDYPFDKQSCPLRMSSAYFDWTEIQVMGSLGNHTNYRYSSDGKFSMRKVKAKSSSFTYGGRNFSNLEFWFAFERSTNYYLLLLIIPSFILTIFCSVVLFWTPVRAKNCMDLLTFGFVVILAMMSNLQIGADRMPKINQTDRLSIYLLTNFCLITIAMSTFLTLTIAGNYLRKNGKQNSRPSQVLKYKYLHYIFMAVFTLAAIINLVVILSYKNSVPPLCIDQ